MTRSREGGVGEEGFVGEDSINILRIVSRTKVSGYFVKQLDRN